MNPSPNHVDEIKIKHENFFLHFSEKVLNWNTNNFFVCFGAIFSNILLSPHRIFCKKELQTQAFFISILLVEGSKVKYDKVLHLFPSPKIHTNTSERLFNISLHSTLHFPSLPFTTLQVTLQTGEGSIFGPRR